MSERDMDYLARRIVTLERKHDTLARTTQLPNASVTLMDGTEAGFNESAEKARDTEQNQESLYEYTNEIGDNTDGETINGSIYPEWIHDIGNSFEYNWDATEFATELATAVEEDLTQARDELDAAQTTLANVQDELTVVQDDLEGIDTAVADAQAAAAQAAIDASAAQSAAGSAQSAADQAADDALAAVNAAAGAQATAEGKGKVIIQSATPAAAADRLAQNLWIDTTGGANTPKRWNGTAWVAVTDKAATDAAAVAAAAQSKADQAFDEAVDAATAAGNAMDAADGKSRNWFQNDQPTGTGHKVGDTWFDTNDGNRVHRWDGSSWVTAQFGTNAISDTAINAAKLAANAVTEGKILNGAITNDKLNSAVQNAITTAQSTASNAQTVANSAQSVANAAQSAASNAQDDADQAIADALAAANAASAADSKATNAASAASTADGKAVAAATAASNAASAASTADGKAVAAQNTANAKGKVIIQSAAPAAADRLAQNLWIDTTGGANTPKRWVSGTTWAVVTDKAATDAAAAAVTAKNAADAAQSRADDAHTVASGAATAASAAASAASAAQTAANNAQTTANGKNKIVRSTANASSPGNYVAGDQWWKYSGSQITAMWIHSGSAWVSQTLTDSVITNLNAGTITAGSIAADRIAANTITGTHIAGATVTAANMVAGTITAASGIIGDAAIGTAKIIDGSITTAKIANLAVTNAEIANGTIQNAKIANLDAAKITTGTLNAARIAANSINAEKLAIGSFDNLFNSPYLANGSGDTGLTSGTPYTAETNPLGLPMLKLSGRDHYSAVGYRASAKPLEEFVIEMVAKQLTGTATWRFVVGQWTQTDGTPTGSNTWAAATVEGAHLVEDLGNGWGRYRSVSKPQNIANIAKIGLYVQISQGIAGQPPLGETEIAVAGISIRRRTTGELIVDGAITADKITANAITAGKIATNAVTADKIAANAVTADKILANSITGEKLVAGAITGDKIQANAIDGKTIRGVEIFGGYLEGGEIHLTSIDTGIEIFSNPVNPSSTVGTSIATNQQWRYVGASSAPTRVTSPVRPGSSAGAMRLTLPTTESIGRTTNLGYAFKPVTTAMFNAAEFWVMHTAEDIDLATFTGFIAPADAWDTQPVIPDFTLATSAKHVGANVWTHITLKSSTRIPANNDLVIGFRIHLKGRNYPAPTSYVYMTDIKLFDVTEATASSASIYRTDTGEAVIESLAVSNRARLVSGGLVLDNPSSGATFATSYTQSGIQKYGSGQQLLISHNSAGAGSDIVLATGGGSSKIKLQGNVEFTGDTGWVTVPLTSPFTTYGAGAYPLRYRRYNNTVYLEGVLSCATANYLVTLTQRTIAVLPANVRPSYPVYFQCQGSSYESWMLAIEPGGGVYGARYTGASHNNTVWLPLTASWTVN